MGVFSAFADLLSYPGEDILDVVNDCLAAVAQSFSSTDDGQRAAVAGQGRSAVTGVGQGSSLALDLVAFRCDAERLGLPDLEEAYTRAFDLDPASCLYVGHHVFGETPRRSVFMARLAAMYREAGGPATLGELPDYLPLVLRYLDGNLESPASQDLLADAVIPALSQILGALDRSEHPYTTVVRPLLVCARMNTPEPTAAGPSV